jgi:hypothetical protein
MAVILTKALFFLNTSYPLAKANGNDVFQFEFTNQMSGIL